MCMQAASIGRRYSDEQLTARHVRGRTKKSGVADRNLPRQALGLA
jgi:hypothetical protein